tara:strand:+ start:135 stop:362 length:228 start_codon:yes stop_codon:yes gene_type:complete
MKLKYKTRRTLALLILLFGLPIYTVSAVTGMTLLVNLPVLAELLMYIILGTVWVFPLKFIFRGIGQRDPKDETNR